MPNLDWYHKKKDSEPITLTEQEERDLAEDREDIQNQREYVNAHKPTWSWAGSVYNIVQNAQANDEISNITLGWIRSYIDTGIMQTTNGMPMFDYTAFGPTDHNKEVLWRDMVEHQLSACYAQAHFTTAITDAHIFGPGVLEVYQGQQYRTIRVPQEDGTFKEKVIPDNRKPKCGVRAISPYRVTRNPDVTDQNEIGSCSVTEKMSWNEFVVKYGRCLNEMGQPKYKNIEKIPKGSHVLVTKYQDENRDVLRIYANSFGNENDGHAVVPPDDKLGVPIFDRPLKIHDIKNKRGEIIRSMGLNLPGLCNLVFLPYFDVLDSDFQTHSVLGMGLPQHMEGLDTFVQTAFNMTIDNFRLGNTVVIGTRSNDGTTPDFDANTYYGGEFVNADITSTTLGQDRTGNFSQMYDVIQNLAIPGTGININQITGDTSQTAFEFAQRIKANSERAEKILRGWENGPFKRLGNLMLSACLTELTTYELEQLTGDQAEEAMKHIQAGRATRDDYEMENGKIVARRNRTYMKVRGMREDFGSGKTRKYSSDSMENTLVNSDDDQEHMVPMTKEYVYPDWFIESSAPYDVYADSRRMLNNKKIQDTQTMQIIFQSALNGMQIDQEFARNFDFGKLFNEIMERSDFDTDAFMKEGGDDQIAKLRELINSAEPSLIQNEPSQVPQRGPQADIGQLAAVGSGPPQPSQALQGAAQGTL